MIIKITDLKEMDIVLRKDGRVCWVLKNDYTHKMQLFLPDMWGQSELSNYYDDFTYGKDVEHYNEKRDSMNDIVAVCRPKSPWGAIHLMRTYELALRSKDEDSSQELEEAMKEFNWVFVNNKDFVLTINFSYDKKVPTFAFKTLEEAIDCSKTWYETILNNLKADENVLPKQELDILEKVFDETTGNATIRFRTDAGTNKIVFTIKKEIVSE